MGWPFEKCCEEVSKYDIISEVWKSVVVPTIMYGCGDMRQNRVPRMALNAPRLN